MARDGTSLPREIDAVPHGCGEAFPLDSTGLDIDVAPVDGSGEPLDRRVELFFFCDKLGVQPPPASNVSKPGSTEYLSWRRRAQQTHEKVIGPRALEIVLHDKQGHPVPGAKYKIHLPSGGVIEGDLDEQGYARVERLPEGTCRVDFPDFSEGTALESSSPLS